MGNRPHRDEGEGEAGFPGLSFTRYDEVLSGIVELLEASRRASVRAVNAVMTATYWEVGRRIVEHEQGGARRAEYGSELMRRLGVDLTARFGRGFSRRNLEQMRLFYLAWPIAQTVSAQSESDGTLLQNASVRPRLHAAAKVGSAGSSMRILQTASAESARPRFPLSWSHYVRLLSVQDPEAREFYETEALRGGWPVRQLDRQISSKFYERTLLSRNKAAMLRKGSVPQPGDALTPEEEIKDPLVLEFLGLKDEYSESELEDALIRHLETFLLELGGDFTFVGRQRRLRIGGQWYRIDLLFFHRRLRCLVVIDLKIGKFTHADAGQMHLYLNYASENWVLPGENPPVGVILCAEKDEAVVHYALEGLRNKVLAAEYQMVLPDERLLVAELKRTQRLLETRKIALPERDK
jgi:predicted nuclease of restriction endonuclease-like (RecB) superfamily